METMIIRNPLPYYTVFKTDCQCNRKKNSTMLVCMILNDKEGSTGLVLVGTVLYPFFCQQPIQYSCLFFAHVKYALTCKPWEGNMEEKTYFVLITSQQLT